VLPAAGIAVALLLASLGVTATRQAIGPGKPWYEYLMPTAVGIVVIAVLVVVLGS
jgi:hypothetical protein